MKKIIGVLITGAALLLQAVVLYAATASVNLTALVAVVGGSTSGLFRITYVDPTGKNDIWTPLSGSTLDFETLELETFVAEDGTQQQAFFSKYYFATEISGTAGVKVDTTFTYVEGNSPFGSTAGQKLGKRANIVFVGLKYNGEDIKPTEYPISSALLADVNNLTITAQEVENSGSGATWLRAYIGLNDGKVVGRDPFSPADPAGTYTGVLTVTATINEGTTI